jgi:hypothetical protein
VRPTTCRAGGQLDGGAVRGGPRLYAVENFYGRPLLAADRLELITVAAESGYAGYIYGPKQDASLRACWTRRHSGDASAVLRAAARRCEQFGMQFGIILSPGQDWPPAGGQLVTRIRELIALGATSITVAFDDTAIGDAGLGSSHAEAVAEAFHAITDPVEWTACPAQYCGTTPSAYLTAFAAGLPEEVNLAWTGPAIISPVLTESDVEAIAAATGRTPLLVDNFPVNDLTMSGVLHLGPYPRRPSAAANRLTLICVSLMERGLASSVGLRTAARFWNTPADDRELAWNAVIAETPGLAPLARASRSWIGEPGPDPLLESWVDDATAGNCGPLRQFLHRGCRAGLPARLADELADWLDQWEAESAAMQLACQLLESRPRRPLTLATAVAAAWIRAQQGVPQLFGIRRAFYPVTDPGDPDEAGSAGLVIGPNLTDRLCSAALTAPLAGARL